MARTYIADWHWRQGILPAEQVQSEGFGMVKLKVGGSIREGWSYIDPTFGTNGSLLLQTQMIPGAFWYLMPGKPRAQAALMLDVILELTTLGGWVCFLDVEQQGVISRDVTGFVYAWNELTDAYPLVIYTRKNFWQQHIDVNNHAGLGEHLTPWLEEARWVPLSVRNNPATPYASHHARAIDPAWWTVNYSGWDQATMLQFTDMATVANKRTTCSLFRGTKEQLAELLTR